MFTPRLPANCFFIIKILPDSFKYFSFQVYFSENKMRKRAGVGAIQKKKADAEKFRSVLR
jgi:hypothetical protein